MKILLLDVETGPHRAYVWGLFKQTVAISQIAQAGELLCWAAKWLGEKEMHFAGLGTHSQLDMLHGLHQLMSEADCVVHYNGKKFDIPVVNREFIQAGFQPPAPHRDIDVLETVKRRFRFASNKLDFVSQALGLGSKTKHQGFELWVKCLEKDPKAWATMRKYNEQDVRLLEKLYLKVLPWIDRHPSQAPVVGDVCCPKCGSQNLIAKGFAYTQSHKYQRYQCRKCSGWARGHRTILPSRGERMVSVAA